jgi:hypothetical protein
VFEFESAEVRMEEKVKRDMGSFNTGDFFAAAVRKALEE